MPADPTENEARASRARTPWAALFGGILAVALGVLGMEVEAALLGFVAGLVYASGTVGALLWKLIRRSDQSWKSWIAGVPIWLLATLACVALGRMREITTLSKAHDLRYALYQYRQAHHRYPDDLDALVPEYLVAVPLAKNTYLSQRPFRFLRQACAADCAVGCDIFGCIDPSAGTATTATVACGIAFTRGLLDQTLMDVESGHTRTETD